MLKDKKIAIVYDWLNTFGGAERVIEMIRQIYPRAKLFSAVYNPTKTLPKFSKVKTSFIQNLPFAKKQPFIYYPFLQFAFEQFNFDTYDLVISVSSGPAKAIISKPKTFHLNYCLTPPRYLWEKRFLPHSQLYPILSPLRKQDKLASTRPDTIIAISKKVQKRIKKFYQRKSKVIYPGIDLHTFRPTRKHISDQKKYYLIVSRLVGYKKIALVIKVFNQLGWPLKIIGQGRQETYLKTIAKNNIQFLGKVSEKKLIKEYRHCQALIMAQEEDFGLTAIEAQACGRPVITFGLSGARETIVKGKTGEIFEQQTEKSLTKVLVNFDPKQYSPRACVKNAANFRSGKFILQFKAEVETRWKKYKKNRTRYLL